jgi:Fic family protein
MPQPGSYRAFIPKPLPPDPPIQMDDQLWRLLSDADRALGRLDGATEVLPNPDFFVAMYVRHEAVLSSQIEGTQASLVDLLEYEAASAREGIPADVSEIVNHVNAMNHGLKRLETLPLSLRLIREIHAQLVAGVRGSQWPAGEFRTAQNLIGPPGATLRDATFVPPPPTEMLRALDDFERYMHEGETLPVLVFCGLVHAQFETIHPFMDGNGRIGRLLITFLLCQRQILQRPLLYLSYYLKQHRSAYYDELMAVRDAGAWEGWLKFFLRGVCEVAQGATETGRKILALREAHRHIVSARINGAVNGLRLLELLFQTPIVNVGLVRDTLSVSQPTANSLVNRFTDIGLLREMTGRPRNRLFSYDPYLALFESPLTADGVATTPADSTASATS